MIIIHNTSATAAKKATSIGSGLASHSPIEMLLFRATWRALTRCWVAMCATYVKAVLGLSTPLQRPLCPANACL